MVRSQKRDGERNLCVLCKQAGQLNSVEDIEGSKTGKEGPKFYHSGVADRLKPGTAEAVVGCMCGIVDIPDLERPSYPDAHQALSRPTAGREQASQAVFVPLAPVSGRKLIPPELWGWSKG